MILMAALVACIVVPIAAYFISVAISGPKGNLDAIKEKNSGQNQIFSRDTFQEQINGVKADVQNVGVLYVAWQADPSSVTARKDYFGTVQVCNSDVAGFNGDAAKFSTRDFLDAGLPRVIDTTDPLYNCEQFGMSMTPTASAPAAPSASKTATTTP
jgi:hypothetical protein